MIGIDFIKKNSTGICDWFWRPKKLDRNRLGSILVRFESGRFESGHRYLWVQLAPCKARLSWYEITKSPFAEFKEVVRLKEGADFALPNRADIKICYVIALSLNMLIFTGIEFKPGLGGQPTTIGWKWFRSVHLDRIMTPRYSKSG